MNSHSMRVIFQVFLVSILWSNNANSFEKESDSISALLPKASGPKLADLYLDLGLAVFRETGQTDTLIYYCNIAIIEAKRIGNIQEQVYAYKLISSAHALSANYSESDQNLAIAMNLALAIKDTSSIADINNKLGYNSQMENRTEDALNYYIQAATSSELLKDWDELAIVYLNISTVFSALRRPDEMKLYILKMLSLLPLLTDNYNKVSVLTATANSYAEFSEQEPGFGDSAIFYAEQGLKLSEKHGFWNKYSELLIAEGNVFLIRNDFEKSIDCLRRSLTYRSYLREAVIYTAMMGLQRAYMELDQLSTSELYLDSMKMQVDAQSYATYRMETLEASYELYQKMDDPKRALTALEGFKHLQDSLVSVERAARISELEQQYNRIKNEKTIQELNQKSEIFSQENEIQHLRITQLIFGISLLIVVLLFGAFVFWQSNKNKERTLLEVEQRLNRARMNPHFVFNVLAAVQTLSMDEKRRDEVSIYLARFSKIMRQSLESTFNELTPLEQELEFLTTYLDLQKLLTNQRFNYEITVDPNLDTFDVTIPGMLIQPFIENAIEHGFRGMTTGGLLQLRVNRIQDNLVIHISDNGKGVSVDKTHKNYPSRATQIISDRLYLLKIKTKRKAHFEIGPSLGGGIQVEIFLPLLYTE